MNNTVENDFFWISQGTVANRTGEVDNLYNFHVKFSPDFTCQKSLKTVNF